MDKGYKEMKHKLSELDFKDEAKQKVNEACTDTINEYREVDHRHRQGRWYFVKQRLIGILLIVLTLLLLKSLDGDATIALITVLLALLLIFSNEMYITDSFYWEIKEREQR